MQIPLQRISNYINTSTKIKWQCLRCKGIWKAKPSNIFNQHTGCPHCRKISYSKKAIRWLTHIEHQLNINIQHAENDGEYLIPLTKLKVDGFCKGTNTVYEFYGDIWHGNPQKFKPEEKCCPYHKLTADQLFRRTIKKENTIRALGYNLTTIWESDYDKQFKEIT